MGESGFEASFCPDSFGSEVGGLEMTGDVVAFSLSETVCEAVCSGSDAFTSTEGTAFSCVSLLESSSFTVPFPDVLDALDARLEVVVFIGSLLGLEDVPLDNDTPTASSARSAALSTTSCSVACNEVEILS